MTCDGKTVDIMQRKNRGIEKHLYSHKIPNILVQFPPICLIELAKPETILGAKLELVPLSNLEAFL